ncbi:MAG: DEAD/DEAH box helicase family protein, partial [Deltaproteobacteria bacterium]|nr:DEAD/DEAH box helicase family protein [Deltaproteobacteria bacterium]
MAVSRSVIATRRHICSWDLATDEERYALFAALDGLRSGLNEGEELVIRLSPTGRHVTLDVRSVSPYASGLEPERQQEAGEHLASYLSGAAQELPTPTEQPSELASRLVHGDGDDPLLPELQRALDFAIRADIAVAFVKPSGVDTLRGHLLDFLEAPRRGRLRLLCGDYLDLTDPVGLRGLLDLEGHVELRIFETAGHQGFHPKAWIFHGAAERGQAFIGSSNLSRPALKDTVEWNYRMVSTDGAERASFEGVVDAFEQLFRHRATRALDAEWVESYDRRRKKRVLLSAAPQAASAGAGETRPDLSPGPDDEADVTPEPLEIPTPHRLQQEALDALATTRREGNAAGLVVLATGLGKTWLAAFDSARSEFKRVLFVAHREEILNQAQATFRRIRPDARFGRFTGKEKTPDADVLFASIQTLGKARYLETFAREAFDYIVVDEFHHAAASTYRRLIGHFTPTFMLGLTATPERTDGGDLLTLCDDNLVYRADLARGIEEGLLCSFRYWGVPDDVDYKNIPWRSARFDEHQLTEKWATRARAENSLEHLREKGGSRALVFCCSVRHANYMAEFFKQAGVKAVALHSSKDSAPRASSLEALRRGELQAICAVDMLNEGVDVPEVDTVLMLRPTESAIIWLQQLGRGLRKAGDKVLNVIDYIGNHRTFLIKPLTLMAALGRDNLTPAEALAALRAGLGELPEGCEVTYDLEVVSILSALVGGRSKAVERIRQFYHDYSERHGERPRAAHAYWERLDLGKLRKPHGGWFGFVAAEGGLSGSEQEVFDSVGEFFKTLETTPMTKSYKMVLLSALIEEQAFPGSISIDRLGAAFARRAKRTAELAADADSHLVSEGALRRMLEEHPIPALV